MTEPSFILDGMLGSLARWLRILGYDAIYSRNLPDSDMLALLQGNERHLLTRDRQLAARAGARGFFIDETELNAQLIVVMREFQVRPDHLAQRCTSCNGELEEVDKTSIRASVKEGTWNEHEEFWRCRECGKVYWQGAHWKNIRSRLNDLNKDP